ncbi:phosphonate C-P lyase system protein PhnG [Hydrogenophaga taeniospiralis CCUG 15921]|uniref:Phosphonate C-P lyase system protein PhnG n=1 Tax=Hydrogenophaga taeniospiralis CCUG 15921 TaxID=1281780 RepID=A0A9X4S7Y1_9BURK|nr:phosphonate C-P lyase system protein PhnG [Hydrogenophaga taeniospiralis]MDG5975752.1 phosphonate C-P lyase system protein PhnG [Hydrogenophaga taeniospiralis CCUG 15921]
MFHAFDNPGPERSLSRPGWMALLARAPLEVLEAALGPHDQAAPRWLRTPETGLMMVQGRAGGTGERFNLGEVTVTRCALRLPGASQQAPVGVAYVMGRSHRHAQLAALADALLQDPSQQPVLEAKLLQPVREHLAHEQVQRQQRVQSTKVEFFTVARESGGADDEEEGE